VIGSNAFNLAALLGLGALVAGRIGLHRRVVWLSGSVAVWVATGCLLAVLGPLSPLAGLLLVAAVLVAYVALLGLRHLSVAERVRSSTVAAGYAAGPVGYGARWQVCVWAGPRSRRVMPVRRG
jgi:Na+/proline symporter